MAVDTEGRRNVQEAGELRVNCCRSIIQSRGKGCFSTYADSYVDSLVIMKSRRWISTSCLYNNSCGYQYISSES